MDDLSLLDSEDRLLLKQRRREHRRVLSLVLWDQYSIEGGDEQIWGLVDPRVDRVQAELGGDYSVQVD